MKRSGSGAAEPSRPRPRAQRPLRVNRAARFDVVIVGAGMLGSAAARYLCDSGASIGIIGPTEPKDPKKHAGVFASHYDVGRITRALASDEVWAQLAQRSMARYSDLETQAGTEFHHACGFLWLGPERRAGDDPIVTAEAVGRQVGVKFERLDADECKRRFPFLDVRPDYCGLHEQGPAGCIDPRALVQAQLTISEDQGAERIDDTVSSVGARNGSIDVETLSGRTYGCSKVLIAAGGFTNCFRLLERSLVLDVLPETVWLGRASRQQGEQLRGMPSMICHLDWHQTFGSVYITPPLRYPDGHLYIKIGGFHDRNVAIDSFDALNRYFRSGGSSQQGAELRAALGEIIPVMASAEGLTKPCIVAYSPTNMPIVDSVADSGVYVAAGGCGAAAKSSDEIGRMAALLVEHDSWQHDLSSTLFRAEFGSKRPRHETAGPR